jgi:predicted pyridoxine 5'-phosphate oxidase superfamily flavin-nucleotide-binding protein
MYDYHSGEVELQELAGETETARRNGKMVASTIPPGARSFLAKQRLIATGRSDREGRVWASLWFGEPGFARAENEHALDIEHAEPALEPGQPLAILAIDLGSRRRFRINGVVSANDGARVSVKVREAYVNCPQYIQRRELVSGEPHAYLPDESGEVLDATRQVTIAMADTLFVASRHATTGADVSHRGGNPGFVRVLDEKTLRVPDYRGNGMFNTLGNLRVDPRAGLVVPDFERGRMLLLTGTTRLLFEAEEAEQISGGTGRYWDFHVERFMETSMPARYHWEFLDASPHNP